MLNTYRSLRRAASSNAGDSNGPSRRLCRRQGPVGLTEVLDSVNPNVEHLLSTAKKEIVAELQGCVNIKYVLASSCSRLRTGEQAAVAVIEGVQEKQGLSSDDDMVITYATWENNPSLDPAFASLSQNHITGLWMC